MEAQEQLKRWNIDGLPEAVMLRGGAIRFRHYLISVHAIDRFVERSDLSARDIVPMLDSAYLACASRSRSAGARRVIRTAESRGGYVLLSGFCYFIVVPDAKTGLHVVSTVMTPRYMGRPILKAS